MPRFDFRALARICLMLSLAFFAACAPRQTPLPVEVLPTQPPTKANILEPESTTHGFNENALISSGENPLISIETDPWRLIELSRNASPADKNDFTLRAIELFLDQAHFSTALTLLESFKTVQLRPEQQNLYVLLQARYALLNNKPDKTTTLLGSLKNKPNLNLANQRRLLQLEINLATQTGEVNKALNARFKVDALLKGDAKIKNQQKILLTLLRSPDYFHASNFNATFVSPMEASGWQALAQLRRTGQFNQPRLNIWRSQFPQHSAIELALLETIHPDTEISAKQIALLLPLSSRLGRAALAFKKGFDAALNKDGRFDNSRIYDIGNEAELSSIYYQSAVNDGADFIIGPLGRKATASLLQHLSNSQQRQASNLLLGELLPEHQTIPNIWGLALSPEQDAIAIAENAIKQGHQNAALIAKNNQWGARISAAFKKAFEAKGGKVVSSQRFLPKQVDNTLEVKNLLSINDSEIRHLRLQKYLGLKLKFSVRRNDQLDFIFLAGNASDARNIMPLIKFYRGHDLPIFSPSGVYSGKKDRLTDADLKGLRFADLPWVLSKNNGASLPYTNANLNRLYALGYAAFEAIPEISKMQSDPWHQFMGSTMTLNMDENRNLLHQVAWGQYSQNGIIVSP